MCGLGAQKEQQPTRNAEEVLRGETPQSIRVEAARLDGQEVEVPLLVALQQNVLLDGLLTNQAVDVDLPSLPDAVAPVLSLQTVSSL